MHAFLYGGVRSETHSLLSLCVCGCSQLVELFNTLDVPVSREGMVLLLSRLDPDHTGSLNTDILAKQIIANEKLNNVAIHPSIYLSIQSSTSHQGIHRPY